MEEALERRLAGWLRQQRSLAGWFLPLAVLFGVFAGLALVVQAALLARVLHGIIIAQQPVFSFAGDFAAMTVLLLLRAGLVHGRERAGYAAGQTLRRQLRALMLDKLSSLGPACVRSRPVGEWAGILLEQIEGLHDYYARYLPQIALAVCLPLLVLAVLVPFNWLAAAILLCTAPLIPLFMTLVGLGAGAAHRRHFAALRRLGGHFMDRLQGLATLRLFWRTQAEEAAIADACGQFRQRTMAVLRLAFLSSAVLEFFAAISIALLALYFGFSFLGELDFGHYGTGVSLFSGLLALLLAPEFFQPLRDLGTHYHARAQAIGAAEELFRLLQTTPQLAGGNLPLPVTLDLRASELVVLTRDGCPLLGPLDFDLPAGQRLMVVGPSGSGKTTLLYCLCGFLPYAGSLTLGGVELREIDPVLWRRRLGWLGQEPQLFRGSLRENLALAQPQADDDALWQVLERVGLAAALRSRPEGLDALIGEGMAGLSVGEVQRLALARALLQDVGLFLLDEPTASLDAANEIRLLAMLAEVCQNRSCLLVTHRLDRLMATDRILVLERGRQAQTGSFAELATAPGLLADLLAEGEA